LKRKICVVINSRANYARIKSVLSELKKHSNCELQIVVGASGLLFRFGKVIDIIKKDGFEVTKEVYTLIEGNDPIVMAKTTGLATIELAQVFFDLKPDIVVTVADRHETLATAIAASYLNIPVAHTQGGEITGSIDELVRHACTKLSHIHFPATQNAQKNILQMGEESHRVHLTGCPSLDFIDENMNRDIDSILKKYLLNPGMYSAQNFLLVLFHPDTQSYLKSIEDTVNLLSAIKEIDLPTIWIWPNVDAGTDFISKELRVYRDQFQNPKIQFVRNFTPEDYVAVLNSSLCIVGNSSSGIREASRIGTPSVSIGDRQKGRQHSENVIFLESSEVFKIVESVNIQIHHGKFPPSRLYGNGKAGEAIANILLNTELDVKKKFIEIR
jgi:UDP-hydrolysing UDP-N-acetyl-D-glucosamine 2-epimerase